MRLAVSLVAPAVPRLALLRARRLAVPPVPLLALQLAPERAMTIAIQTGFAHRIVATHPDSVESLLGLRIRRVYE